MVELVDERRLDDVAEVRLHHRRPPLGVDPGDQRARGVVLARVEARRAAAAGRDGRLDDVRARRRLEGFPGSTNAVGTTGTPAASRSVRYRLSVFHSRTSTGLSTRGTAAAQRRNSSRRSA